MRNVIRILVSVTFLLLGCDSGGKPTQSETVRDVLKSAYRLRPDNRFVLAVARTHRFMSGQETAPVSAEFTDGGWRIGYRGQHVGVLPEFPDFSNILVLLQDWANTLQKKYAIKLAPASSGLALDEIQSELDQFSAMNAAKAALRINASWKAGSRDPVLLSLATRALVSLSVQSLDRLETGDILPAHALTVLAMAKAFSGARCEREESLLAYTMGYAGHAETIATNLPDTDPVRLYVMRNAHRLKMAADAKDATAEARYLLLLRLADQGQAEPFVSAIFQHFPAAWLSLPVFKAGLNLGGFHVTPALSEALPRLVLLELAREVNVMPDLSELLSNGKARNFSVEEVQAITGAVQMILTAKTSSLVDRFESGLKILDQKYAVPFLDSETYQAYFQGYFFSALSGLGRHYLDSLSSTEAAGKFAELLGKAENGIVGDFHRWYRNLASSKAGKGDLAALVDDLLGLSNFGAPALMRTIEEQQKYFSYGDPLLAQVAKAMVVRMDTRVQHRRYLGHLAYTHLLDLNLMEKLQASVLHADPSQHQDLHAWYAFFTGNEDLLLNLLHSQNTGLKARAAAIGYFERLEKAPPHEIRKEYQQLIRENPDNWSLHKNWAKYLQRTGNFAEARLVIDGWLKRDVGTTGMERILAQGMIAGAYYKEGLYKEGWATIEPIVKSQQAGVMENAAKLLDALGRGEEAEKMAEFVVARYPDLIRGRALSASIYWRHGKHDKAAELLKSSLHRIGMEEWRFEIAPGFADAFEGKPKEDGLAAFSMLLQKGFSHFELLQLTYPVSQKGNHELAFRMSSQLRSNGMGHMEFLLASYRYLKEWKGKDNALAWLTKAIPAQMLNPASMAIFREGQYDLLWDLIRNPEKGEHADFVWLMRAAASAKMGAANDPNHQALSDYCKKGGNGTYHMLTRFLAGLATEKEVLALATDPKKRCEIAYYIGLRAQGEGRYADASDWYRVSIETGLIQNGEYRWAHDTLSKWQSAGKSLARLADERL